MASEQPSISSDNPVCPGCQAEGSVLLPCGHHLCQSCLQLCQHELGQDQRGCTECYGRELLDCVLKGLFDSLFQDQPRRIGCGLELGFGGSVEGTDRAEEDRTCARHGDRLTLFCTEDEELICTQCQEEHKDHECVDTEEAAKDCKTELSSALSSLSEKLETLNTAKQNCQDTAGHIRRQAQHAGSLIKDDFEKLHKFLRDEETSILNTLKEEEELKTRKMKEKLDRLTDEITSLMEIISSTEQVMNSEDFVFLKNYKKTSERMECTVKDPEDTPGALIDMAKHLGCLKFRVWEKMQTLVMYTPVTLDPNTADACLSLSDDLASIHYTEEEEQHLPNNPERFRGYEGVLAAEGFSSGRHSWDVEVGDSSEWALGVAKDSIERKEWFPASAERGMWTMSLSNGQYRASDGAGTPLSLKRKPQKVCVQLDWDAGRVMFSDAGDNTLLYKFKDKFMEKLFPYFSNTCKRHPLCIAAEKVSVYTE
ncbi:E3 ubiquitin-protein ligase TRIM39 [Electrophorus electricus]|uniref:Uncharacterized protein n=1 Tax=Electrophorus electricus TaxID=8005 RepID=A0A4W4EFF2_ELEEL|nr:E3 ubiquitin-protein ligase TRIM39 [Electrophorus electricus]